MDMEKVKVARLRRKQQRVRDNKNVWHNARGPRLLLFSGDARAGGRRLIAHAGARKFHGIQQGSERRHVVTIFDILPETVFGVSYLVAIGVGIIVGGHLFNYFYHRSIPARTSKEYLRRCEGLVRREWINVQNTVDSLRLSSEKVFYLNGPAK
jgi:hypothetical protein